MKTTVKSGKPHSGTAPFSKSESHTTRARHRERALTPPWPWPPARLVNRNPDRSTVLCPACHIQKAFKRCWCSHCGEALP